MDEINLTNICPYCNKCSHCEHPFWTCPEYQPERKMTTPSRGRMKRNLGKRQLKQHIKSALSHINSHIRGEQAIYKGWHLHTAIGHLSSAYSMIENPNYHLKSFELEELKANHDHTK